jgi:hypothetical protein
MFHWILNSSSVLIKGSLLILSNYFYRKLNTNSSILHCLYLKKGFLHNEPASSQENISQVFVTLIWAMISRQLFYLSGSMSVALNKTICLFIEKHSNISLSIQIQKTPNENYNMFILIVVVAPRHVLVMATDILETMIHRFPSIRQTISCSF